MGDNRISFGRIFEIIAALITIIIFITGYQFLPQLWEAVTGGNHGANPPPTGIPEQPDQTPDIELVGIVTTIEITEPNIYQTHNVTGRDVEDFTYEATVQIESDALDEFHGLLFRQQMDDDRAFYSFRINRDGLYSLSIWTPCEGEPDVSCHEDIVGPISSELIQTSKGAFNVLKVVVRGQRMDLLINGQKVIGITDTTYENGGLGFVACTCNGAASSEVSFFDTTIYIEK